MGSTLFPQFPCAVGVASSSGVRGGKLLSNPTWAYSGGLG